MRGRLMQGVAALAAAAALGSLSGAAPKPAAGRRSAPAKPSPRGGQPLTMRQRYERAERFASAEIGGLVSGSTVEAHWTPDGSRFWYRREGSGGRRFLLVDAERGRKQPAFDHDRLARALSAAAGRPLNADRLPFTAISLDLEGRTVSFRVGSQGWRCDLASYECRRAEGTASSAPEAPKVPELAPREPGESPDGRWVAFTRDQNVFVRPRSGGAEARLSDGGEAGNAFGALSWSPNSRYLAAWRTRPGENGQMYNVESAPAGQLRPKLRQYSYALPGDRVDTHELWVFDVESRRQVRTEMEPVDWGGPPDLRWSSDGRRFTLERTDRGYQRERVLEVDAESGRTRTIIDERSRTFVFPPVRFLRYLDATGEILWTSERDGWNHLYLIDARTGIVKRQITQGPWVVRAIESVDEARRQVIFAASGREPGRDPYLLHYYRVGLDGTGLVCLTPGNGEHGIRLSPDRRFYLDTYSRVDLPPVTELRRAADGGLVLRLEAADVSRLQASGWRPPEPFHAPGRDGKTPIWGVIYRPSDLNPRRKYPVIEDIYAGPQGSSVPKSFSAQRGQQALAELGFIVVQIDGMGTGNRSKAFHDVAYKNLGDSGFPDRIAWMRAAARKYPYMDLSRVGIYGVSAGGYNAAHALIARPDFYKVAVSIAGNHDHRTDKVWWNELWMGYPVGPHYAAQSNVVQAHRLKGRLLLVHGELDDNVNPSAATLQFVNALIQANKDFDLIVVPGAGHGYGTYVQRRLWDYFVRYLQRVEPPREYPLKAPADNSLTVRVRNELDRPVTLYWVESPGTLRRYRDVPPGQTIRQHSFVGHEWEAHRDGRPVSWYTVSAETPEWVIEPAP